MDRKPVNSTNPDDETPATTTNFKQTGILPRFSLGHMGIGPNMAPSKFLSASMQPHFFQCPLTPTALHGSVAHQIMKTYQAMMMTAPQAQMSQAQAFEMSLTNFLPTLPQPPQFKLANSSQRHAMLPPQALLNLTPKITNTMPSVLTPQNSRQQSSSNLKEDNSMEKQSVPTEETKTITIPKRKKETTANDKIEVPHSSVHSEVKKRQIEQNSDLKFFARVIDDTNESEFNQGNTSDLVETHFLEFFLEHENCSFADVNLTENTAENPLPKWKCGHKVTFPGRKKDGRPGDKREVSNAKVFPKGTRHKVKKRFVPKCSTHVIINDEEINEAEEDPNQNIFKLVDIKFFEMLLGSQDHAESETMESTSEIPLPESSKEQIFRKKKKGRAGDDSEASIETPLATEHQIEKKSDLESSTRAVNAKKKKKALGKIKKVISDPVDIQCSQPLTKPEDFTDTNIPNCSSTENGLPLKEQKARRKKKRSKGGKSKVSNAEISCEAAEQRIEEKSVFEGTIRVVNNKKIKKDIKISEPLDIQFLEPLGLEGVEATESAENALPKPKEELKVKKRKKGAKASNNSEVSNKATEKQIKKKPDLEGSTRVVNGNKVDEEQKDINEIICLVDIQFLEPLELEGVETTESAENPLPKPKEELKVKKRKKGAKAGDKIEVPKAKGSHKATKHQIEKKSDLEGSTRVVNDNKIDKEEKDIQEIICDLADIQFLEPLGLEGFEATESAENALSKPKEVKVQRKKKGGKTGAISEVSKTKDSHKATKHQVEKKPDLEGSTRVVNNKKINKEENDIKNETRDIQCLEPLELEKFKVTKSVVTENFLPKSIEPKLEGRKKGPKAHQSEVPKQKIPRKVSQHQIENKSVPKIPTQVIDPKINEAVESTEKKLPGPVIQLSEPLAKSENSHFADAQVKKSSIRVKPLQKSKEKRKVTFQEILPEVFKPKGSHWADITAKISHEATTLENESSLKGFPLFDDKTTTEGSVNRELIEKNRIYHSNESRPDVKIQNAREILQKEHEIATLSNNVSEVEKSSNQTTQSRNDSRLKKMKPLNPNAEPFVMPTSNSNRSAETFPQTYTSYGSQAPYENPYAFPYNEQVYMNAVPESYHYPYDFSSYYNLPIEPQNVSESDSECAYEKQYSTRKSEKNCSICKQLDLLQNPDMKTESTKEIPLQYFMEDFPAENEDVLFSGTRTSGISLSKGFPQSTTVSSTQKGTTKDFKPKVFPTSEPLPHAQLQFGLDPTVPFNSTWACPPNLKTESEKERPPSDDDDDVDELLRMCMPPFDYNDDLLKMRVNEPLKYQLLRSGIPMEMSTVAQTFREVKEQMEHIHNPEKCYQCQLITSKKMKPQSCDRQCEEPKVAPCEPNISFKTFEPMETYAPERKTEIPMEPKKISKTSVPTEIHAPEKDNENPQGFQQSSRRKRKFNRLSANQQKKMNRKMASADFQKENVEIQSNFVTSKPFIQSQASKMDIARNNKFRKPFGEVSCVPKYVDEAQILKVNQGTAYPHERNHIQEGRSMPNKNFQNQGAARIRDQTNTFENSYYSEQFFQSTMRPSNLRQ